MLKQTPSLESHIREMRFQSGMTVFGIGIMLTGMTLPTANFDPDTINETVAVGLLTLVYFSSLYRQTYDKIRAAGISPPVP